MMKDPLEKQYNYIVLFNFIFVMLFISFLVYFNPFGLYTANSTATEANIKPTHMNIVILLAVVVVAGNIALIMNYYSKKGKKHKRKR